MRSKLLPLAILILAPYIVTVSCVSLEYSETTDELDNLDYSTLGKEMFKKADQLSSDMEAKNETLPENHSLTLRAKQSLKDIISVSSPDTNTIGGFKYFDETTIRLVVLVQDAPLAQVYPNGVMFVTTGLIDQTLPYSAKNQAQLAGVIAHEFVHLREGHVLRQWSALEATTREIPKNVFSKLTRLLPVVRYDYGPSYNVEYTYNTDGKIMVVHKLRRNKMAMDYAMYLDQIIEYEADVKAMEMLNSLDYDQKEYLVFLENLSHYRDASEVNTNEPYGWIDQRLNCLSLLFSPAEDPSPQLMLNSKKDMSMYSFPLDSWQQYGLCMCSHVRLSPHGGKSIEGWIKTPVNRDLQEILEGLSEQDVEKLKYCTYETLENSTFGEIPYSFWGPLPEIDDLVISSGYPE